MLLRNLDLKGGLCNGTRLMVRALHNSYIDGEVLTGVSAGNRVFVPRVQLAPSDANLPFTLKRRQFPVRLAYSMTINKSQGQTFEKVGVYLKKPCFLHGQLYVACSRTRSFNSLFFKVDKHPLQDNCPLSSFMFVGLEFLFMRTISTKIILYGVNIN
ncbi:ATP-dependent DNA helicase PIF1-like [Hydra vulgaris]|uniref:ATP-dependent DNA helicase PIF1-like n=1 Tax=Hydra vulgaris TaxID=6087 RepID=UPI0032EA3D5E